MTAICLLLHFSGSEICILSLNELQGGGQLHVQLAMPCCPHDTLVGMACKFFFFFALLQIMVKLGVGGGGGGR